MRVKLCGRLNVSKLFFVRGRLDAAPLLHASRLYSALIYPFRKRPYNPAPVLHRPSAECHTAADPRSTFLQNARLLAETLAVHSWSSEVQHALANLPFRITIPLVVHILKQLQNARVVLCFFFWLRRVNYYRHNNLTYSNAVHLLIRAKEFRFFEQIFFCLQEDRCYLNSITCNALIQAYGAAERVEEAFNVYSRMDGRILCRPNILTCNLLLHSLIKANELNWAHEFYHRILDEGFIPDIFTCNIWMLFLCRSKKLEEAYAWLREMPCPPNSVSYSTLIDGLCKVLKMADAHSLFDRMVEDSDMSPDVFVYSSLIDGYCKAGKLHEAWKLFRLMSENGVTANVVTYTSLLDGMFKEGKTEGARRLLDCMESADCSPNVHLCTVRIDALCKQGNLSAAESLVKHIHEVGCVPNTVTYCAMIDGSLKAGRVAAAMEMMAAMRASGCEPDAFLYASLIYAFGKAGEDTKAKLIMEESLSKKFVPDTRVMNCWMSALCRSDRADDAYHLFINLRADGFLPNSVTYNILITGFSKSGRMDYASLIFEGMQQFTSPDLSSYTNLIKGLCKIGAVSHASKLLVESSNKGFVFVFRFLVSSIMNMFKTRRAYEAKSFLKLLRTRCIFGARVDENLCMKLLEARNAEAAVMAVVKWKRLRSK